MPGDRELFQRYLAQTSPFPMALEVSDAEGIFIRDRAGKNYFDLISGISVSSLGHKHPRIQHAIREQADTHLHLMVYGEYVQRPQVKLAELLVTHLPPGLSSVYLTNSGTEATEGALKLAKRFTGRYNTCSFRNAYHGSSQGALSVCGNEQLKNSFRPLIPGNEILAYNDATVFDRITQDTAAVIVEAIQAEAGVRVPDAGYLKELSDRCREQGALLILDEIQTGMGRTGSLFAFQREGFVPDILLLGKAFGGGMPLGAFVSSGEIMKSLTCDPVLGHITTFGGHPVSCAAAMASLEVITGENMADKAFRFEALFRKFLKHERIRTIRGRGLLLALEFESQDMNFNVISRCLETGVITDWFLFAPECMRLAPPLTIQESEIEEACSLIVHAINTL